MTDLPPTLPFDERWFSTALRSIGDAVIATDEQGRVLFLNPVAEILTGLSDSEAHGKDLPEVFPILNELTRQAVENPVELVLATGQAMGLANHTVLIHRDGREIPVDDSAAPIFDGQDRIAGVILVFRDVTERRRAALVQKQLAAIVESSDDIIASKTLEGVITSWNQGAERILGYSAEEVIGKHISIIMPPEQAEDLPKILDQIRKGERVDHYQTKRRCKDGTIIDVALTISPIRDAEGRIVGASKIGRDITLEKRREAEQRETERRKDEFLAMLAHELRNPLASIGNAALLFGGTQAEEELLWAKDIILRQINHLSRLIDDLLDVSRITRGQIRLQTEPIALAPVVASAVEAVRPLIEERQLRFSVSIAPALRLNADPLRLEQILVNLLSNASKYTDASGRVELSAEEQAGEVVIKVRDSGIGISAELLPHVFDLFVQGDRSAARSEGGLGIGLTVVQKLSEMHGGSVSAESAGPDQGSEFTVRLPGIKDDPSAKPGPASTGPARGPETSARILVVDDMADTAQALGKILRRRGHDVALAYDGPSALEAAREHRPDFVLLDIGLPGMDGYEVARRLRQEESARGAVLIATSGYGQEEDRRRSKEAGFDHHLVKPVDYAVLSQLLASRPVPRPD